MSRIYDSSAITQRRKNMAQAGSFINRIQSSTNPQTSYGPLQGIYDASIINSIKMGQPKEFYRNNGCIIISNGCPCPPIAINEITSGPTPPIILAPGSVRNIQLIYGSVIVTWEVSNTGGTSTSYTVTATATGQTTVTHQGITDLTYTFATIELMSGNLYTITVIGVNSAGNGAIYDGSNPTIDAPYLKPTYTSNTPTTIGVTIVYSSYTAFSPASGTLFDSNGVQIGTGTANATTLTIASGLSSQTTYSNCYFRLINGTDTSSNSDTFSFTTLTPVIVPGSVPSITSVYGTNTNGVDVTWTAPTTGGTPTSYTITAQSAFGSTDIVPNITALTYSFDVSALTSGAPYIITVIGVNSAGNGEGYSGTPSTIYAPYAAPISILSNPLSTTSVNITFTPYTDFVITGATIVVPGATPTSISVSGNNTVIIGDGLDSATIYNNCTIRLTGNSGNTSNISDFFQIKTNSVAPQNLSVSSTTTNSVLLNFDTYTPFTPGSTTITAYNGGNSYVGTNISNGNVTIPLSSGQSYPNMYIVLTTGSIISMPSNEVSFSTPYPAPSGLSSGTSTCITQAFEFTYNDFTPVSASIMNAPSGVSITLTQSSMLKIITLTGLTPSTQYSGMQVIQFRVEGGSGELSEYANIPTFNTPAPAINGNISGLDASSGSGEIVFNYEQFLGFIPTSAVVTANIVGVPTTYTVTGNVSVFGFTLTGLGNGTTLSGITVTLRDLDNCQQSNTATYSGGSVTTKYPAPTGLYNFNLTNNSLQVGFTQYDDFEPFLENQSYTNVVATRDGNTGQPVTISQASRTGVTLTGLFVGSSYTNVILTLVSSTGQAAAGATIQDFTPSYPAPNVNEQSISTGTDSVTIPYAQYTALNPSSGTLYSNGSQIGNLQSVSETQMIINGLSSGNSYYNCYITLTDGSNTSNLSNTFFFATTGPPPPTPSAPAFQNYSNLQETTVEVNYTSYTGFDNSNPPTSGTFSAYNNSTASYINLPGLSANSTTLYVTGLDQGTYYTQCTFIISDGNQTSDTASSSDFTTTSPPPPSYPSPFITNISYSGTNATITYNDYSQELGSFGTPNGGTLYLNSGAYSVNATSADNTTMVVDISGAPLSTIYPNSYITVTNSNVTSNGSNSQTIITAPDNIQVTPHNLAASINYTAYANTTISNVFITDVSDSNITYSSQSILPGSFIMTGPNGGNAYLNPGTMYSVKFYVQTDAGNSLESTISFTTTDSFPAVDIPIIPTQSYPYVTSTYSGNNTPSVGVTFTFTSTYNAFYPFSPDNGELRNDMGTAQGTLGSVSTNSVTINNITPTSTIFTGYTLIINYASFYSSGTAFHFTTYPAPTGVQQTNDPVNPTPPNQVDISFSYYDTLASFNNATLILNDGTTYGTNSINYSSGSGTFSISGIPSVGSFNAYIVLINSGGYALLPSDVFPVTITSP